MPGYNRAELNAELKIVPSPRAEESPQAQIEAGTRAANTSGLVAHEAGPDVTTALAGGREEVLEAVRKVIEASLDAGAHVVQVKVEAQAEAGKFGRPGGRRA
jgi:uncharacterized protein YqgV (UPF0045/DUF77 family)